MCKYITPFRNIALLIHLHFLDQITFYISLSMTNIGKVLFPRHYTRQVHIEQFEILHNTTIIFNEA